MTRTIVTKVCPISAVLSDVVGGHGHQTQIRHGVELELIADESLSGRGEASPLVDFSPDRLEDVKTALEALSSFELTFPERPDQCRALIAEQSPRLPAQLPSARFALEGALTDLFARHLGLSATKLLATMSPSASINARMSLTKLIPIAEPVTCLTSARRAWSRGYRAFKLKIEAGDAFNQTLAALRTLREAFGPELTLRLDPNGRLPVEELHTLLEDLSPFEPELVEEPVHWKDLLTLSESPIPLALDESLVDPAALPELAARRDQLFLRAVVIKPALLGLLRALELSEEARQLGLDVIVTHLFDGPVGHATALSLAQAVGSPHRAQGLAPHAGLLMVPGRRLSGLGQGYAYLDDTPGLPLTEVKPC
jgi:o-succinylbenzoate synthase